VIDTSALEPGTIVAGRYRVASKIGHGGMGAVYLVNHVHTDESLALKVVHAQVLRDAAAIERFRREARAPARITSEHVARVTDADTAPDLDGAPFYVMELLRGRDLERVLGEDGPLPPALVVEYLRQMSRALDKAHALGIVHRDLKPENLFLTHREDGSPCIKLLDFGIARLADGDGTAPIITQVGLVFGTPNYMAPEQSLGDSKQIGPATDIWAIGLLAFKLLVGQEFFSGKTTAQVYAQVLSEPLPTPTDRGCPHGPSFDAWFARCVDRTVANRYPSAGEAVVGLAGALGVILPERHSSPTFPTDPRASQPSFGTTPTEPHAGQLVVAPPPAVVAAPAAATPAANASALPTVLPAGVPSPRRRGTTIAIVAGFLVLVLGGTLTYVLKRPAEPDSVGIVGSSALPPSSASTSASSGEPAASTPPPPASLALTVAAPAASGGPPSSRTATAAVDSRPRSATPPSPRSAAPAKPEPAPAPATLTREQRKRLEALDHLCAQGTYSATECQTKRQAIIHGGP
jgi:eukaryotic-like serine/threonine-protein kinase